MSVCRRGAGAPRLDGVGGVPQAQAHLAVCAQALDGSADFHGGDERRCVGQERVRGSQHLRRCHCSRRGQDGGAEEAGRRGMPRKAAQRITQGHVCGGKEQGGRTGDRGVSSADDTATRPGRRGRGEKRPGREEAGFNQGEQAAFGRRQQRGRRKRQTHKGGGGWGKRTKGGARGRERQSRGKGAGKGAEGKEQRERREEREREREREAQQEQSRRCATFAGQLRRWGRT